MLPGIMVKSLLLVLSVTGLMSYVVYIGCLDGATAEIGVQHYAERVHISMKGFLPRWIKMPFNSVVNLGYVFVGAAWCAATTIALTENTIRKSDALLFYIFNVAACCYGPIQTLRIVTQLKGFAILDQWYTLPFFMLVFLWGMNTVSRWSTVWNVTFIAASIGSYFLSLYDKHGFEISLGVHICFAIGGAVLAWKKVPQAKCRNSFIGALLSCAGFVVLKLLDLELVKYHEIFKYISGHLISKLCDIGQVHFVNMFCFTVSTALHADSKKKEK
ncbi:transmembrane protein 187-like [Ruditapes philippinarum]|uniref:transmembrane protein 187-like n=1 Tax=Ruditapes philippinarum TaxID=129788 RepID=UPI00295B6362|nr:transmembrane protein 187-like [Ruditapes philippinarum]XP_060587217.1 transmembrane protein 187-like [Ruditapes philippinarum]XP_060587219.1 transmembrane protein 187-like [Ruditapes philippinarum]